MTITSEATQDNGPAAVPDMLLMGRFQMVGFWTVEVAAEMAVLDILAHREVVLVCRVPEKADNRAWLVVTV